MISCWLAFHMLILFQFFGMVRPLPDGVAMRLQPLIQKMSSRQTHVTYKAATVAKDVMMSGVHRKDSVRFPSGVKSAYVVPSEAFKDDFLMKINEGNLVKCAKIIW